jgi:hypothetical protein
VSALASQQAALLAALFEWPAGAARSGLKGMIDAPEGRGFQVYQANGHMLAERALLAAYPVVARLIGLESFRELARALWHAHPPQCGDAGAWGAELAQFIGSSSQLADLPYASDVARLEWSLHRNATVHDAQLDVGTLQLLTTNDPCTLHLCFSPGAAVLRSEWPIVTIWNAHQNISQQSAPDWSPVAALLRQGTGEVAMVWRSGWQPQLRLAMAGEADAVQALLGGSSLSDALECAPSLDFGQWFPVAVQSGLVLGVELHT